MSEKALEFLRATAHDAGLAVAGEEHNPDRRAQTLSLQLETGGAVVRLELREEFLRQMPEWPEAQTAARAHLEGVAGRLRSGAPHRFATLNGMPLEMEFQWPAHRSGSGADWYVVHGLLKLADGSGLVAEVSGNMTITIAEKIPALEQVAAEPLVINAVRKAVDENQVEFRKSGKLQPVPISMRHYSFSKKRFSFSQAGEDDVPEYLKRKVFWAGARGRVWMADPYDALYLNSTPENLLAAARALAQEGEEWLALEGDMASPTEKLLSLEESYRRQIAHNLEATKAQYAAHMQ